MKSEIIGKIFKIVADIKCKFRCKRVIREIVIVMTAKRWQKNL